MSKYGAELFYEAISFISVRLRSQEWHNQPASKINNSDEYYSILLKPYKHFTAVMDDVVKEFSSAGWYCKWAEAHDARGPHECFYVSKKHFD